MNDISGITKDELDTMKQVAEKDPQYIWKAMMGDEMTEADMKDFVLFRRAIGIVERIL